jgi:hypothetical protein
MQSTFIGASAVLALLALPSNVQFASQSSAAPVHKEPGTKQDKILDAAGQVPAIQTRSVFPLAQVHRLPRLQSQLTGTGAQARKNRRRKSDRPILRHHIPLVTDLFRPSAMICGVQTHGGNGVQNGRTQRIAPASKNRWKAALKRRCRTGRGSETNGTAGWLRFLRKLRG